MPVVIRTVLIGALVGTHVSCWGMYKDAPHEGFTWVKFFRSIVLAALIAPLLSNLFNLYPDNAASAVILFGVVYASERLMLEAWKTFFRNQDQSKYAIPMQLAVFGKPVQSMTTRVLLGCVYVGVLVGGIALVSRYYPVSSLSPLLLAVTLGAAGGWVSAFGGAWKDAPIEGFETFKFFRSPAIAAFYAFLLYSLGATPIQGLLGAIGFTVATTETYKTFFFPSKPRGKFAGKPVLFPDMLKRRQYLIPIYAGIWVAILAGLVIAFTHRSAIAV